MTDLSSMTIDTFCARNEMGRTKFNELKSKGVGPAMMDVDGMQRISIEAEQRWRRQREEAAKAPDAIKRRKKLSVKGKAASAARGALAG